MSRYLRAFKRAPTVELSFDDVGVEVRQDRVILGVAADAAWFSWDEWRDLSRRIEHSIQWVAANTPDDVTGSSFTVDG